MRRPAEPALPPSAVPHKVRKLIATGGEGELQFTRALAEESPQVREATLKQTKLDLVFSFGLGALRGSAQVGPHMAELGGPSSPAEDQRPFVGVRIQAWVGSIEDFVVGGIVLAEVFSGGGV